MADKEPIAESELLQRLRAGEKAAFELMVHNYHSAMQRFAAAMIGDAQAEEVVQEAWLSAVRHLDSFEGRSSLKSWLFAIVGNEARGRLRKSRKEQVLDLSDESQLWAADRFVADGHWNHPPVPWHDDSPEALLSHEDFRRCLDIHLHRLPPMQRSALLMRDVEGMEFEDICNILDISASNVRVLIHRARVKIFTMVEHFEETGTC